MFVMDSLTHVLENYCKAGVMDVKLDNGHVDIEVTRKNIKC